MEEKKRAFRNLIDSNKSLFFDKIYEREITIDLSKISKCLYCYRQLDLKNPKEIHILSDKFCSKTCRDIFYNLNPSLVYNFYVKNLKCIIFRLFVDGKELTDFLDKIPYDDISNIYYSYECIGNVKIIIKYKVEDKILTKSEIFNIHEYVSKQDLSITNSCLFCSENIKEFKFIETKNKTFIGPICDDLCKNSLIPTLLKILEPQPYIPYTIPSFYFLNSYIKDIREKIRNYKNITGGCDNIRVSNNNLIINLSYIESDYLSGI